MLVYDEVNYGQTDNFSKLGPILFMVAGVFVMLAVWMKE